MFPRHLRREILLLLGVKAAALAVIYFAFVAPAIAPEPSGPDVQAHVLADRSR